MIKILFIFPMLAVIGLGCAYADTVFAADRSGTKSITAEQWELAREGARIAALPGLATVVQGWAESNNKLIEIHYPGGEEGEIWVNELKGWLVSLGVASRYMMAIPGSGQADVIRFKLINDGDSFSE